MAKKHKDIVDIPAPSEEAKAAAKQLGAKLTAYDPNRLEAFLAGGITLGDLEGITKDQQYQLAKTGYDFLNEGVLDKAKTVFEGLLALDPYDAYFHTALGSIAQQSGDFEEADERYSRALEINPFSPVAFAHRGEIRLSKGMVMESIEDFVCAVREDPDGKEPATVRARALLATIKAQLEASAADPDGAAEEAKAELHRTGARPLGQSQAALPAKGNLELEPPSRPNKPVKQRPGATKRPPTPNKPRGPESSSPSRPSSSSPTRPSSSSPTRPSASSPTRPRSSSPGRPRSSEPGRPRSSSPGRPRSSSPGRPRSSKPRDKGPGPKR